VVWIQLHKQYQHVIIKTFRSVGLSLNPDGLEDIELKVKGLPDIAVGDYSRKELEESNGLGSLIPVDIIAIATAQAKLAVRVAKTKAKKNAQITRNQERIDIYVSCPFTEDDTAKDYDANNLIDIRTSLRDLVEESSDDEGEYEEVFTLGRINTRL
jgi:hypothetical protein